MYLISYFQMHKIHPCSTCQDDFHAFHKLFVVLIDLPEKKLPQAPSCYAAPDCVTRFTKNHKNQGNCEDGCLASPSGVAKTLTALTFENMSSQLLSEPFPRLNEFPTRFREINKKPIEIHLPTDFILGMNLETSWTLNRPFSTPPTGWAPLTLE